MSAPPTSFTRPPPPINTNGLSVTQASKLQPGAAIIYRDPIAVNNYAATVSAVTPGQSLTVNVTSLSKTLTFDLVDALEGTMILPLFGLS